MEPLTCPHLDVIMVVSILKALPKTLKIGPSQGWK
jgi:hypothetical protein